jgi:hypothetical protein
MIFLDRTVMIFLDLCRPLIGQHRTYTGLLDLPRRLIVHFRLVEECEERGEATTPPPPSVLNHAQEWHLLQPPQTPASLLSTVSCVTGLWGPLVDTSENHTIYLFCVCAVVRRGGDFYRFPLDFPVPLTNVTKHNSTGFSVIFSGH